MLRQRLRGTLIDPDILLPFIEEMVTRARATINPDDLMILAAMVVFVIAGQEFADEILEQMLHPIQSAPAGGDEDPEDHDAYTKDNFKDWMDPDESPEEMDFDDILEMMENGGQPNPAPDDGEEPPEEEPAPPEDLPFENPPEPNNVPARYNAQRRETDKLKVDYLWSPADYLYPKSELEFNESAIGYALGKHVIADYHMSQTYDKNNSPFASQGGAGELSIPFVINEDMNDASRNVMRLWPGREGSRGPGICVQFDEIKFEHDVVKAYLSADSTSLRPTAVRTQQWLYAFKDMLSKILGDNRTYKIQRDVHRCFKHMWTASLLNRKRIPMRNRLGRDHDVQQILLAYPLQR